MSVYEVIDPSGQIIARIPRKRMRPNMIIRNRGREFQVWNILSNSGLAEAIEVYN